MHEAWTSPRTSSSRTTSTTRWKNLRPVILNRDNHTCQIRGPYCTGTATVVDHITNTAAGGDPYDPDNLQAACVSCNNRKAQAESSVARRIKRTASKLPAERHPGLL